jgi:hypothetical protein
MSSAEVSTYDVVLTHLSSDAKQAGIEFSTTQRAGLSTKELRTLLKAAGRLAPHVVYPATPEVRVSAPSGNFVVQLKDGRLQFVSWASLNSRGGNPSAEQIADIITGQVAEGDTGLDEIAPTTKDEPRKWRRGLIIGCLAAVFIGANCFTYFHAQKPPGNFLPHYRLMEPAPAERLLSDIAGNFETGAAAGDRRLQIRADGSAEWLKFGAARAIADRKPLILQAVNVAGGTKAILTSRQGLITIKDQATLVMYGDTYLRVAK